MHAIMIADRAGKSFLPNAHAQGFARWKGGNVSIEQESTSTVVAKVRGARTYDVVLREEQGKLLVHCTCPARTFDRPGCKHVWAALLEVDRRGALTALRERRGDVPVRFLEPSPPATAATPRKTKDKKKKKNEEKPKPKPKPKAARAKA